MRRKEFHAGAYQAPESSSSPEAATGTIDSLDIGAPVEHQMSSGAAPHRLLFKRDILYYNRHVSVFSRP